MEPLPKVLPRLRSDLLGLLEQGHELSTASLCGSPLYMAPEVWREQISPHSDQYSLAVTYAEMRHGKHPFKASNLHQVKMVLRCVFGLWARRVLSSWTRYGSSENRSCAVYVQTSLPSKSELVTVLATSRPSMS